MIIKRFPVAIAIVALLALCGCAAPTKVAKIQPGVGVGSLRLGMTLPQVIGAMGEPRVRKVLDDGIAYSYPSVGVIVFAQGERGKSAHVTRISAGTGFAEGMEWMREFWGETKEGVGINSTREEVEKKLGAPDPTDPRLESKLHAEQGALIYRSRGIYFLLRDNKVVRMTIFPASAPAATRPVK